MRTRWVLWYLGALSVSMSLFVHAIGSPWISLTHGSPWILFPPILPKSSSDDVLVFDDDIWELISNFSQGPPASLFSSSSSSASSFPHRTSGSAGRSDGRVPIPIPPLPPSALQESVLTSVPHPGAPGYSPHLTPVKVLNGLSGGFHFSYRQT